MLCKSTLLRMHLTVCVVCYVVFPGGKGGLHVPNVLKSGNLKFLKPSEHAQTCNGIPFNRLTKSIWSETMYQMVHNVMKTLVHNVEL